MGFYEHVNRMTKGALSVFKQGYWVIGNGFIADANGDRYPLFIHQLPAPDEREEIWKIIRDTHNAGRVMHVFERLSDARAMFGYDYDDVDDWGLSE